MTKMLILTLISFNIVACNQDDGIKTKIPRSEIKTSTTFDSGTTAHVENAMIQDVQLFETDVKFSNFERHEEDKVYKALEIIKMVVRSEEFRLRVINFSFRGKKQFYMNNGLSNNQIYQTILQARELLRPEIDHEMDLELELFYTIRSTVGYTTTKEMKIYMNRRFFNIYTPSQVAGNIFHEWTHKLGFTHSSRYTSDRDSTVPYALGYLVENLGKRYESLR